VKIRAKIVLHGWQFPFEMAEVMVPHAFFAEILTKIT
jgi:hypothetical protein